MYVCSYKQFDVDVVCLFRKRVVTGDTCSDIMHTIKLTSENP